jgi:glycerol-3-phosphate dehydrogenase
VLSWDGQLTDDARLVVALARTAAGLGARILTYVSATALTGDGATLRDERTGAELTVRARAVVNATGVWADQLDPEVTLRPSRGSHLVVRNASLGEPRSAATVPVPGEPNRFLLVLPQPDGLTYIGLTDEPTTEVVDEPVAPAEDRDFLLATVNRVLDRPLTEDDVVGTYAGLRPLVAAPVGRAGAGTADLSRRHLVRRNAAGVVTVTGGKLTTYRKMAEDAVDAVGLTGRPCGTRRLPLVGAGPVPTGVPERLVRRYGSEAARVAAAGPLEPVAPGLPVLAAELAWGVTAEGALTVDDLLARRTRLALVAADAEAARPAAERALAERAPAAPRCH